MSCEKKQQLLTEYNDAVSEWAEAIERLKIHTGVEPKGHGVLEKLVDGWHLKFEIAKAKYIEHLEIHGCHRGMPSHPKLRRNLV